MTKHLLVDVIDDLPSAYTYFSGRSTTATLRDRGEPLPMEWFKSLRVRTDTDVLHHHHGQLEVVGFINTGRQYTWHLVQDDHGFLWANGGPNKDSTTLTCFPGVEMVCRRDDDFYIHAFLATEEYPLPPGVELAISPELIFTLDQPSEQTIAIWNLNR